MAGAPTYHQAFTDPFCETASASPRPASPSASAHLSSLHMLLCRRRHGFPCKQGKPPESRGGRLLLRHLSQCPGAHCPDPVSLSGGGCLGNVGPDTRVHERVRRPRNQAQVQPSRHTGSRNTFNALVDLRGTVPDRSPPEALCLTRGRSGRPLLAASCTPYLTFTFWPCLMACGIFVS